MSCQACGHDLCQGDCPPNQPLVYEDCKLCGTRVDWEDLSDGFCRDCVKCGYTRSTTECHRCGNVLTQDDFFNGTPPYVEVDERGLTVTLCPECIKREKGEA